MEIVGTAGAMEVKGGDSESVVVLVGPECLLRRKSMNNINSAKRSTKATEPSTSVEVKFA